MCYVNSDLGLLAFVHVLDPVTRKQIDWGILYSINDATGTAVVRLEDKTTREHRHQQFDQCNLQHHRSFELGERSPISGRVHPVQIHHYKHLHHLTWV